MRAPVGGDLGRGHRLGRATTDDLIFRPAATAQLELAGTLALNTGIVILTYRVR